MKRLKTVLNSNCFYIALTIITIFFIVISHITSKKVSIYNVTDTNFNLMIMDYELKEDKLTLSLKGKESLIGTLYIKNNQEYNKYKKMLKYGLKVLIKGELQEPNNNTIPNCFNYKKYLNNKNIYYTIKIKEIIIEDSKIPTIYKIKNIINKRIDKVDQKGYIKAFILGDKSNIDKDIYSNYQKIGITHLFALSGMHISLLSSIILKFIKKLNIKLKYTILNIILLIYGYIVSFPSSIKRCIVFFLINSINKIFKLNIKSFNILLLTIFLLIITNYKIIYDIAFIYSVFTVGAILLYSDLIKDHNKLKSSFKLSIIAFLFSMPITLSSFYSINFLSILFNIVYIPFISIIVYPLSLLSFVLPQIINVFNLSINVLEYSSNILSQIDYFIINLKLSYIEVIIYYVLLIISLNKKNLFVFSLIPLLFLFHFIIPYIDSNYYIYYFDVSQGDSSLILSPHKKDVILIDTGGIVSYNSNNSYKVSDNVITFLKSISINKINTLVLTHGDYDHMGEIMNYINNFKVEKVILNCGEFNHLEQNLIKTLSQNKIPYYSCIKELNINDNKLYFLNDKKYNNENDNSSVIYTILNNHKFIFMGDAGVEVEEYLIKKYNLQNIDVLKVGHHGSNTSTSKYFIDELKPKYGIISVGKKNRYGHPNKEVLDNLENSKIYRTDEDGTIMFKVKNNELKVETYAP